VNLGAKAKCYTDLMPQFTKQNFILTTADLLVNLSAGWFGVLLIFPQTWITNNWMVNIGVILQNLIYGTVVFLYSIYLKDFINAK
jgi:hypothetical protein